MRAIVTHGFSFLFLVATACSNGGGGSRAPGTGGAAGTGQTDTLPGSGGFRLVADDAGLGSGGAFDTGADAAGGAPMGGAGGANTIIATGTGGKAATGGSPGRGGAAGRGPIGSEGGAGGRVTYDGGGGAAGTGGGGTLGRDAAVVDTSRADAPPVGCVCSGGMTTWDCYCQAYDCTRTIDAYAFDGGLSYDVMVDWADCNLVEYVRFGEGVTSLFDRTTRRLVGELRYGTDPAHPNCPFPVMDSITGVKAGTFPGSSCVASECMTADPTSEVCTTVPMTKKDAGRF
jgi:hypothetical protein